jgi:hypothetical protein
MINSNLSRPTPPPGGLWQKILRSFGSIPERVLRLVGQAAIKTMLKDTSRILSRIRKVHQKHPTYGLDPIWAEVRESIPCTRNTVHLDHLKRFMPIAGYGSSRSPETVHLDHSKRLMRSLLVGVSSKINFAIGHLRPESKFKGNLEEGWMQRPWPQGGYPCERSKKS